MMKIWKNKYNQWKKTIDWKSFENREAIDEAIVNKLSEMLDDYEERLRKAEDMKTDFASTILVKDEYINHLIKENEEALSLIKELDAELYSRMSYLGTRLNPLLIKTDKFLNKVKE